MEALKARQRIEAGVCHPDTEAQVDPLDIGDSLRDVLETIVCELLAVLAPVLGC